ncbi:helix-turn-helix domain-containing protein [Zhihengliuella flava]|uniref:Lambda repressor-like predicted transcriptional regulator n=1 Tax=Zhihengliuella flava TaxID=1285193 RepID=A0A931D9A9_9MICC|nr:helix-turn-helix domain-containing protein [Zhihengliuella flava]MBG6083281.1 lambda repressor-like predicted transcriptional regulator [Zhihengliuella flava]
MSNRDELIAAITEWTAHAVQAEIDRSGMTKVAVSDETGIPYPTLNRKLAAKTEFSFRELLLLAEALNVEPSTFTPPAFERHRTEVQLEHRPAA